MCNADQTQNKVQPIAGWLAAFVALVATAAVAGLLGYTSQMVWNAAQHAFPLEHLKASTFAFIVLGCAAGSLGGGLMIAAYLAFGKPRVYEPDENGLIAGMITGVIAVSLAVWSQMPPPSAMVGAVMAGILFGGGGAGMTSGVFWLLLTPVRHLVEVPRRGPLPC